MAARVATEAPGAARSTTGAPPRTGDRTGESPAHGASRTAAGSTGTRDSRTAAGSRGTRDSRTAAGSRGSAPRKGPSSTATPPRPGVELLEVDANGLRFPVRVAGPVGGTPVVLLHGFPQTSWAFRATMSLLAEAGYRAVAPDQRGYAARARPQEVDAYSLPHLVADVRALSGTLEIGPFHVVGHDWGGIVAWSLAARSLDLVRSLAIVSTPCPPLLRAQLGQQPGTDPATRSRYLEMFRSPGDPELALVGADGSGAGLRALFGASGLRAPASQEYVDAMVQPGAMTAALNWFRAMHASHVTGMPPVVVPTLAVWSSRDVVLSRSAAAAVQEFAAGRFRFEVLDGVSHWVPDEAPERLGELLVDHLADL